MVHSFEVTRAWIRSLLPDHIFSTAIIAILMVTPLIVGAMHVKELLFLHLTLATVWTGAMGAAALFCAQRMDSSEGLFRPINPQLLIVLASTLTILSALLNGVKTFGLHAVPGRPGDADCRGNSDHRRGGHCVADQEERRGVERDARAVGASRGGCRRRGLI